MAATLTEPTPLTPSQIPSPAPTYSFEPIINPWFVFEQTDTAKRAKVDGMSRMGDQREYRIWVTVFGLVRKPLRYRTQYKADSPQPIESKSPPVQPSPEN